MFNSFRLRAKSNLPRRIYPPGPRAGGRVRSRPRSRRPPKPQSPCSIPRSRRGPPTPRWAQSPTLFLRPVSIPGDLPWASRHPPCSIWTPFLTSQ